LTKDGAAFYEVIRTVYGKTIRALCNTAAIGERAFRNYKYKSPPKRILLAVSVALGFSVGETDKFLRKFGYCLSEAVLTDCVVAFYLRSNCAFNAAKTLNEINETLYSMGIPTLV